MECGTGIGAVFVRTRDPEALAQWYANHLGVTDDGPELPLRQPGLGKTLCLFPADADYFGRAEQSSMLNLVGSGLSGLK